MPRDASHFKKDDLIAIYTKYRPSWPPGIFQKILDFCRQKNNAFKLALDLGCGSGQGAIPLAPHFEKIHGIDASEAQLSVAKELHNMSFTHGPAEDLSMLSDESVDLVMSAAAIHWMDRPTLYEELRRVTRSGAVFAVFSFRNEYTVSNDRAQTLVTEYLNKVRPFFPTAYDLDDNRYRDIESPFGTTVIRDETFTSTVPFSIDGLRRYNETMAYQVNYQREQGHTEALDYLIAELQKLYDGSKDDCIAVTFHFHLVMSAKDS